MSRAPTLYCVRAEITAIYMEMKGRGCKNISSPYPHVFDRGSLPFHASLTVTIQPAKSKSLQACSGRGSAAMHHIRFLNDIAKSSRRI